MMHKTVLRSLLFFSLLLAGLLPAEASGPAPVYRVRLPAETREERSALVAAGYDIEYVGPGWVSVLVTGAELARLKSDGAPAFNAQPVDFPPKDALFHNYDEVQAALAGARTAHPDIVLTGDLGTTAEGRKIPYVKISDEPGVDDPTEPAALFLALTHAREHLSTEMALAILRMFTEAYGADAAITRLVNEREIYIVPIVNPDGGEYDIEAGAYRYWRKNRRSNDDGSFGVDLNRNFGYQWGCCGGSSAYPPSDTYRGPNAFSEPEIRALADFVVAHPDITVAISFHTYGELILYPYGYTYDDLPRDMRQADLTAMQTMAKAMASTNGYSPQQASDLYITSGDALDWLYGERGILAFTFEMYPAGAYPGFYPPASEIERETERNLPAVLYLTRIADPAEWVSRHKQYVPYVAK